eukprot:TRINITY_DN28705_c0_g2_i1.p1 TRINITY_DN28705_c0_g2~~TRINITY_DN28705_c0_g2_i1.p1  ORF type:complete len:439 (+),score=40.01 TRINITY_DN28705_c0_g2_i1:86-1402(+)
MSIHAGLSSVPPEVSRKSLAELQERYDVLHEVLLASGLMRPHEMETRLHRRRFAAIQRKHPCFCQQSLSDTIAHTSVAFHVESFMHLSTIHTVRSASQAFRSNFANRTHAADLGEVYWCSSIDPTCSTLQLWESYDFTSNKWVKLPCPRDLQRPIKVVGGGGSVYLCEPFGLWCRYDAALKKWQRMAEMPSMRCEMLGALVEVVCGNLYVGGGSDDDGFPICAMERFDPVENVWEELPRFSDLRIHFDWSVISGTIYVCGGVNSWNETPVNQLECYDPQRNVWEQLPGTTACWGRCGVVGLQGCLYAVGGTGWVEVSESDTSSPVGIDAAERYCPREQAWTALPPMREKRQSACLAAFRGCLYVSSGLSLERFDPASGYWEHIECRQSVVLLRGSSIFGATLQHGFFLKKIVRFNSATKRWEDMAIRDGLGAFVNHSR